MEPNLLLIEPLLERAEKYGKTSVELIKLKAIHKSSQVMADLIFRAIIALILALFLILVTIGASLWLGEFLGKTYYGFFCVSIFYLIIGFVLYVFMRTRITNTITNTIIYKSLN